MKKVFKIFTIAVLTIFALLICFMISVPIVNDFTAMRVASEITKKPLPENSEIAEKMSIASKLTGCGNGMQYFGAVLLKSDLPLEEIKAHYGEYDFCAEQQTSQKIEIIEHGDYTFKSKVTDVNYYIVYNWGEGVSPFDDIDIRGH